MASFFVMQSSTETKTILSAAQKHFATDSIYFKIKDTKRPDTANDATVAHAKVLKPSNMPVLNAPLAPLGELLSSDSSPKANPNE
jgi:hypothetical protein